MPGCILIADPTPSHRIALKARLAKASYKLCQAADAPQAARMAREVRPQLVLADAALPSGGVAALCAMLRAQVPTAAIPVLAIAERGDAAARCAALAAGAEDVIHRALPEAVLLARIRSVIRRFAAAQDRFGPQDPRVEFGFAEPPSSGFQLPGRIGLIAAGDPGFARWQAALAAGSRDSVHLFSPAEALSLRSGTAVPDVFVLACRPGGTGDGLDLVSELRSRPATRHASLILLHRADAPDIEIRALDMGAEDVLEEPCDPRELALRVAAGIARKRDRDRLRRTLDNGLKMATLDPLTGLLNRRAAETRLARIAAGARETGAPFAALVLDLDRFKRINDTYGHAAGDAVLSEVATRLRGALGDGQLLARLGGEEFLAVLPDTDPGAALLAGARLLTALRDRPVGLPLGPTETVTASCGIAHGGTRGESAQSVLERADAALYRAKAAGRDRLEVAPPAAASGAGHAAFPTRPTRGPRQRERVGGSPLRADGGTGWPQPGDRRPAPGRS